MEELSAQKLAYYEDKCQAERRLAEIENQIHSLESRLAAKQTELDNACTVMARLNETVMSK